MSSVDSIFNEIKTTVEDMKRENDASIKIHVDREAGIIRIYNEGSSIIKQASSGLADVLELAYTTAEHHPYWAILYNATEICKTILDKWDSQMTSDQLSEMSWRCDEIKMAIDRLQ
ncbi:MAG: hypothetical protein M3258_04170 [Thermoproteota archaeon]|jgi:hypothetical protein|nr:hypothetical protein [Thermoproteota archaeon]